MRAFCLTNANLRGVEQVQRVLTSLDRILDAAQAPRPYVYGIYADGLRRLWPGN